MLSWIAFDADDTLWHSESYYADAQQQYTQLLAPYALDATSILAALHQTEIANLPLFGYGIKGFAFSMIETAIQLSDGHISGREIQHIITIARAMLTHEITLLDHVRETVAALAATHRLMLITKGDLIDQQRKITSSGLAEYFQAVEIVSDKTPAVYQLLFNRYNIQPEDFLMVGNSLRSDVLPVIALGGWGVYVPYAITWAHEHVLDQPADPARFFEIPHLGLLQEILQKIENGGQL